MVKYLKKMDKHYKYDFSKKIETDFFSIIQEIETPTGFRYSSYSYQRKQVTFDCKFEQALSYDNQKPVLVLCIKDEYELLKYTLDNLKKHKVDEYVNILVVDDRPQTTANRALILEADYSYLKVDNSDQSFNFSMLNNLAVHYVLSKTENLEEIILWNSDLWAHDEQTFPTLLERHRENKNTITGTKLLYPTKQFYKYKVPYSDLVQYGGALFGPRSKQIGLFPSHLYRGYSGQDPKVNCDKGELFVTGAFSIFDAKWFVEVGGFNPSLAIAFQDVDIGLKATEMGKRVLYYGKDLHFYHGESLTRGKDDSNEPPYALIYKEIWKPDRVMKLLFKI